MLPEALLTGENAAWLDQQYCVWLEDSQGVQVDLAAYFSTLEKPAQRDGQAIGAPPAFVARTIFNPPAAGRGADLRAVADRQAGVAQLINAYRVRGHMEAAIDPLGRREQVVHPELTLPFFGLTPADLEAEVPTAPLFGMPDQASIREIVAHLRATYCGSIGAEFMNITDNGQKHYVQRQLETLPNRAVLNPTEERRVFRKLCDAENFERMLHTRFPGTKRFSLEGAETLIPLLDLVIEHAGAAGVDEVVVGMAHRGRLNTLVNILEKPAKLVVDEFQDSGGSTQGSGDVKYHMGYSADTVTVRGDTVHLSLTPNPSHLEAVNTVVQGRVRAKQERAGDDGGRCMALLMHGDAAFSGQGLVMETLNLSELRGYRTGGTLHVIVNNQIGFTTPPSESRSTPYATDIARMLGVPIFHVNGEDPRAVAAVVQMAVEYRMTYRRDVVIDMYCYRKHGHNEGDEPSFTQPLMYKAIRARPTPRFVYGAHLNRIGVLTEADLAQIDNESKAEMSAAALGSPLIQPIVTAPALLEKGEDPDLGKYFSSGASTANRATDLEKQDGGSALKGLWERFVGGQIDEETDTSMPTEKLVALLRKGNTVPDGFNAHAKIRRLLKQRSAMIEGERPMDWAMGEIAAFATLLDAGYRVRLSGQDCGRGTFSHRHAVVTDIDTNDEVYPLAQISPKFDAIDSSLSESGVLGFEVGYSFDCPDGLILWEAQFGDFSNGGQIIIDQFITAAEQKWNRLSGLVMMLPHGYEGQGPEHSSARIERYLLQCGEGNIQVANVTTPAQLYHLFRRQTLRNTRKPLILFTPKSLLRHPKAVSSIADMADGKFHRVLVEQQPLVADTDVKRVVFCSGKLYYELLKEREAMGERQVALVRVELLYPFPAADIHAELERYPNAEAVWCQEEPKNMGAWPVILHWMLDELPAARLPRYVGRNAAAAPATGSHKKHQCEQAALIAAALSL